MAWTLVPCLATLRAEINELAPDRDRASDGSIGDPAHADRVSSHNPDETGSVPVHDADDRNEVHAIDVDDDLREPGLSMEMIVDHTVSRCRSGAERRLRNIIYNRRIWAASSGWVERHYDGANPHDKHAHFEASYETAHEASTASWRLEDIPVALTSADKTWIAAQISAAVAQVKADNAAKVDDILATKIQDEAYPTRTVGDVKRDVAKLRGYLVGDVKDTANAEIKATSPVARIVAAADKILGEES